jgi:hypothetical protein
VREGDDLTTFIVPKVEKIRRLNLPDPQGPAQACSGKILLNFILRVRQSKKRDHVARMASDGVLFKTRSGGLWFLFTVFTA